MQDFPLHRLNVVVGGNGSGKSNFISALRMVKGLISGYLNTGVVPWMGGVSDMLYRGLTHTDQIRVEMTWSSHASYYAKLQATASNSFVLAGEGYAMLDSWKELGFNNLGESNLSANAKNENETDAVCREVYSNIRSWNFYHFSDSGVTSGMRREQIIEDEERLRVDGSNIAPFLYGMKRRFPDAYKEVVNTVRVALPFFDDFLLKPITTTQHPKTTVKLCWTQKGSDYPMQPYHLSDGAIRFICLVAALCQPELPSLIVIDEPELGLHPGALAIVAELMHVAATKTQLIVATQSPSLLNYFSPEDIIVASQQGGESAFQRYEASVLDAWLAHYSMGELFEKNIIEGGC